jgi:hypothetical protein
MTVGLFDPEAQALSELASLAAAARDEAMTWESFYYLTDAELSVELVVPVSEAGVVGEAILAVDKRWRVASGLLEYQAYQASLTTLVDETPGLVIAEIGAGSVKVIFRRATKVAGSALAAALVFTQLTGYQARDAIDLVIHHRDESEHCEVVLTGETSAETRKFLSEQLSQVPPGCSITVRLHAPEAGRSAEARHAPDAERPTEVTLHIATNPEETALNKRRVLAAWLSRGDRVGPGGSGDPLYVGVQAPGTVKLDFAFVVRTPEELTSVEGVLRQESERHDVTYEWDDRADELLHVIGTTRAARIRVAEALRFVGAEEIDL